MRVRKRLKGGTTPGIGRVALHKPRNQLKTNVSPVDSGLTHPGISQPPSKFRGYGISTAWAGNCGSVCPANRIAVETTFRRPEN